MFLPAKIKAINSTCDIFVNSFLFFHFLFFSFHFIPLFCKYSTTDLFTDLHIIFGHSFIDLTLSLFFFLNILFYHTVNLDIFWCILSRFLSPYFYFNSISYDRLNKHSIAIFFFVFFLIIIVFTLTKKKHK